MSDHPLVKLADLEDVLLFADAGSGSDTTAWVCRDTGAVLWRSDDTDDFEPLPEDIDDAHRYVAVPGKADLDLGKPLALEFTRTHLPACYEQVRGIFAHRGAYARFKDLLESHQRLDAWYQWEAEQTRQALRTWCADNGIPLAD